MVIQKKRGGFSAHLKNREDLIHSSLSIHTHSDHHRALLKPIKGITYCAQSVTRTTQIVS